MTSKKKGSKAVKTGKKPLKKKPLQKKNAKAPKAKMKAAVRARMLPPPPAPKPDIGAQNLARVTTILTDSNVRQILIELGGENALAIIRSFYNNHSDEELAKKLKLKISDVRATLNKLHNEGLVNYIREKDSETGWYSYSWSLNLPRIEKWANLQVSRATTLGEGSEYYFCASCGTSTIMDFSSAANGDFRCERCNKLLEYIDEKKMVELYEKKK